MPWRPRRSNLAQVEPPLDGSPEPCTTDSCSRQASYLEGQLDFSADPCHDLYDFVCGNYSGHPDGPYAEVENAMRTDTISSLSAEVVPAGGQTAFQKAAGLFQTCIAFAGSSRNELQELESWMLSLGLDLLNLTASQTVDPVDMMTRLAIEIGFPVVFEFRFSDDTFLEGKRAMQFRISELEAAWRMKRYPLRRQSAAKVIGYFSTQLRLYPGYYVKQYPDLATKLYGYDEILTTALNKHVKSSSEFQTRIIEAMGAITAPHVTPEQWTHLLGTYTKGAYKSLTMIQFQKELLNALKELLAASNWGKDGFRAMLAWRLFDGLSEYVQPAKLMGGKSKQKACYNHVLDVMEFSMTSRYLRSRVTLTALKKAEDMFWRIRDAFDLAIGGSSWLKNTVREFALRHLDILEFHIGSIGNILDESFVNEHYAAFPEMSPSGQFLEQWLKARSARAQEKWSDHTRVHFHMSRASPYYVAGSHALLIPAGALLPIFADAEGNPALHYGAFGNALAHQIMNAYDVFGEMNYCYNEQTRQPFTQKVQCLRDTYSKAGFSVKRGQRNPAELENLGDMVGAALALDAFRSLPGAQQTQTLPDLNLTATQLFFVGHCMTTCKLDSRKAAGRFASARARCIVPAMNMDDFWAVFDCPRGTRMNPDQKCSFWK
ncbi:neprilysin-1-like [Amblyomma americanum]